MAKLNRKVVEEKKKKKSPRTVTRQRVNKKSAKKASPKDAPQMLWAEAIDRLKDRRFAKVDDAVEAMIEQVLLVMEVQADRRTEARAFLVDVFGTDPELRAQLGKVLGVR